MRAIILLNGEPYAGKIDAEGARVYCCDGAYRWAHGRVRIDENLGDFDSLASMPDPPPREIYPAEKDMTDGEIALGRAISDGARHIIFYGGGGGREDHFLGNLHLLYAAFRRGVFAEMVTNYARIFVGEGLIPLAGVRPGRTISLLPFGADACVHESGGLKYPLCDLPLRYGSTRGISNVVQGENAFVRSEGALLVLIDREGT